MLLVGTNVLVDVLENDPAWAEWSVRQLRAQSQVHDLIINPVIYAELSLTFDSVEALDDAIDDMQLTMQELPAPRCFSQDAPLSSTSRRWPKKQRAGRLLHRCACCSARLRHPHSQRTTLSKFFSACGAHCSSMSAANPLF